MSQTKRVRLNSVKIYIEKEPDNYFISEIKKERKYKVERFVSVYKDISLNIVQNKINLIYIEKKLYDKHGNIEIVKSFYPPVESLLLLKQQFTFYLKY